MPHVPLFHIRCLIDGISPPIWRSLQVPGWLTFHQLDQVISTAFEWSSGRGAFEVAGLLLLPESEAVSQDSRVYKLEDLFMPGLRMVFKTGFSYTVTIQVAGLAEAEPAITYPDCIGGERSAPPEGVEGPQGYARLLKHPKQRGLWNPERFDISELNRGLADLGAGLKPEKTPEHPIPEDNDAWNGPGAFLRESDVQFDLHAYYVELETSYWREPEPANLAAALTGLQQEELLGLCMVYGIAAEEKDQKQTLEDLLKEQLPEAMRLQVPYMDDRQFGLLRLAVDNPDGAVRFSQAEILFSPYELYYFRDRLLLFSRTRDEKKELYILPEVREAMRMDSMQSLSRTQLRNANRRRIIAGMFQYYGVLGMGELQELLSAMLEESVEPDTIVVDIQELQDFYDAVTIGDHLIMHTALDPEKAEEIWLRQSLYPDLPYYQPSLETLDLAGDWLFVEVIREAGILISYLESRYQMNTGAAEGVSWELMHRFRWGEPLGQAMEMAHRTLTHPDEAARGRFEEMVASLWMNAPTWRFKGWSPLRIREMALHPDKSMAWLSSAEDEFGEALHILSEGAELSGYKLPHGDPSLGRPGKEKMKTEDGFSGELHQALQHDASAARKKGKVLTFPGGPRRPKRTP